MPLPLAFLAFGFSFFGLIALPKVEREKTSFQCGTKEFKPKVRQGKAIKPKAKAKEKKFLSTYSYQLHKNKILFSSNSSKYKQKWNNFFKLNKKYNLKITYLKKNINIEINERDHPKIKPTQEKVLGPIKH